jgi:hypothetical protein
MAAAVVFAVLYAAVIVCQTPASGFGKRRRSP